MKNVLVLQHVAHEILGTFHPLLKEAGFRIRYVNFGRHPDTKLKMERYDGLFILGGPMGVYEAGTHPFLLEEIRAIQEAIRQEKPVLGICLGAQLIAATLGAEVKPSPVKEVGWYDLALTEEGKVDPILGTMNPLEKIFQWHGDVFDLPRDAVWLARSEACPHQAFRFGDRTYGFQFHLEVDEPAIERWLLVYANRRELESLGGEKRAAEIRADTRSHIARTEELSRKVFTRFIQTYGTRRRMVVLGSVP